MTCFHPKTAFQRIGGGKLIWNEKKEASEIASQIKIPCGVCIGCILDHCNDTATRCWCETQYYNRDDCCFITLTYNNESLGNPWITIKDEQDFWKRLRYYKKDSKIKYMGCAEYGPTTFRKHFHFCVWGYKPKDLKFYKYNKNGDKLYKSKELQEIWGNGFVIVGELTYRSACYVARYCTKKLFKGQKHKKLKELGLKPECTIWSKGIGLKYWNEYKEKIKQNNGIMIKIDENVKNKRIPKYFMKKFKDENPYEYECYTFEMGDKVKEQWDKILSKTSLTEKEYLLQQERNLLEKAEQLLKRTNFI